MLNNDEIKIEVKLEATVRALCSSIVSKSMDEAVKKSKNREEFNQHYGDAVKRITAEALKMFDEQIPLEAGHVKYMLGLNK